ncbi:helix-turn-helix transcriptional regulator [Streptosporangium sandarakinum]|uniref:helix-turn-helix transcriptional regulator n=1 Tax=Streptosporangium sandarakinum TaxID=1260955 RepID=UPI0037937386
MSRTERPSEVLARQVRAWRERRKLSAQDLANRIAEDDGTLDRLAISKIENGKRGISLDEWLQLAYALAVPPPLLFLDLAGGGNVAIVPGAEVHPWLAWEWATGEEPPVTSSRRVKRVEEFNDAAAYVRVYREERVASEGVHKAQRAIWSAEYTESPEQLQAAKAQHVEALRGLAKVLNEMVERGMNPPGKPREWVELMRNLDMLKYPEAVEIFEPDDDEV